jgi:hypothetical protein
MTTTVLSLNRSDYMQVGEGEAKSSLDYLSAKYKNIGFHIRAQQTFIVTHGFESNAPGIAFELYRNVDYWPFLLMSNGIIDPIENLPVGTILQVPSKQDIDAFLSAQDSSELTSVTI